MGEMQSKDSWRIRRRIVFLSLVYCAGSVSYIMLFGDDSELNRSIVNGLILLAASVIGSYVFGAVWDDKIKGGR